MAYLKTLATGANTYDVLNPDDENFSGKAPINSPAFTGTPTAPTPTTGDDSTNIATTQFVQASDVKTVRPRLLAPSTTYYKGDYVVYNHTIYKLVGQTSVTTGSTVTTPASPTWAEVGPVIYAIDSELGEMAYVDDADSDGKIYARKDGGWVEVKEVEWGNIVGDMADQTDLQNALDDKLDAESVERTGDIITFESETTHAIKDLKVAIEPVQDLHGYSNPWPAGGGKNLIDYSKGYSGTSYNSSVGTVITLTEAQTQPTVNGSTVTFNCDASWKALAFKSLPLPPGNYHLHVDLTNNPQSRMSFYRVSGSTNEILGAVSSTSAIVYDSNSTITTDGDYFIVHITSGTSGTRTFSNMQIESGSAFTSWSSYSNICPIMGWTQTTVSRTGKNQVIVTNEPQSTNEITVVKHADGSYTFTATSTIPSSYNRYIFGTALNTNSRIKLKAGVNYYISGVNVQINGVTKGTMATPLTYTANEGDFINACWFWFNSTSLPQGTSVTLKPMIQEGASSSSDYLPWVDNVQVTIDLDGTRYGGTLDVTAGTVTVNTLLLDLDGTENGWVKYGTTHCYNNNIAIGTVGYTAITGICSHVGSTNGKINADYLSHVNTNRGLQFKQLTTYWGLADNEVTTWTGYLAQQKTNGTPVQVLAYLTEPVTLTLTPHEIASLIGDNVLFADRGSCTVELRLSTGDLAYQDTVDYNTQVTGKPTEIASVESAMVATKNYTSGALIEVAGKLYRATSNIANGTTLTVGSNVVLTTVEAELALKAVASDTYTKSQVYAKTETDTALALKADKADTYTKAETEYVAAQSNEAIVKHIENVPIASFDDGADNIPVKGLKIAIEPVQDLHGYDNPWPGGGGKNLLPFGTLDGIKAINTNGTWNGNVYTRNGISFTVLTDNDGNVIGIKADGTSTNGTSIQVKGVSSFTLPAGEYLFTGVNETNGGYDLNLRKLGESQDTIQRGYPVILSYNEDTTIGSVYFWVNSGKTISNVYVYPMIRLRSVTDDTFEPYANVCPISGWTQANVTRTGRNLCNSSTVTAKAHIRAANATAESPLGSVGSDNGFACSDYIRVKPNTVYTTSTPKYGAAAAAGLVFFGDKSVESAISGVSLIAQVSANYTFTTPNRCNYVRFSWATYVQAPDNTGYPQPQLNEGTQAPYQPYQGAQITIALGSTVYGGTLDVMNGTMRMTHAYVDLSTLSWTTFTTGRVYSTSLTSSIKNCLSYDLPNMFASNYATRKAQDIADDSTVIGIGVNNTNLMCRTGSADNPTGTLVYELASPIEVSLSPSQLSTLLGKNCIWSDTGDIIDVAYCTDTESYIQKNSVDKKGDVIIANISDVSIASFNDGADDAPVENLVVGIEPVQDLHGYNNPWPGGGGRNFFDISTAILGVGYNGQYWVNGYKYVTVTKTETGFISTDVNQNVGRAVCLGILPAGEYILSVTNSGHVDTTFSIASTTTNELSDSTGLSRTIVVSQTTNTSFTFTADGTLYYWLSAYTPTSGATYSVQNIMLRKSSDSDTSFAPYANICPISGWTKTNVTRTGINVWGGEKMANDIVNAINNSSFSAKGSDSVGNYLTIVAGNPVTGKVVFNTFKPNTRYTFIAKFKKSDANGYINIAIRYTDGTHSSIIYSPTPTANIVYTFAVQSQAGKSVSNIFTQYGSGTTTLYYNESGIIEGAVTASDFVPYQGTTVTIALGQTVYGGILDITTWTMTIDRVMVDLGDYSYVETSAELGIWRNATNITKASYNDPILLSSYKCTTDHYYSNWDDCTGGLTNSSAAPMLRIRDTRFIGKTASQVNNLLAGVKFVYKLKPEYYQVVYLSPQELTTLLGINNIWCDTGDIINLDYRSDTKLYIDQKIAEATRKTRNFIAGEEVAMKATKNYTTGDYLWVGDDLYKVTANIANGGTITVGTNVSKCTVGEQLKLALA